MGDSSFFCLVGAKPPLSKGGAAKGGGGIPSGFTGAACPGKRAEPLRPASRPPLHRVGSLLRTLRRPRKAPLTGELAEPASLRALVGPCVSARYSLLRLLYSTAAAPPEITSSAHSRARLTSSPVAGIALAPVRRGQRLRRVLLSGSWWGLPLPSVQLSALPWPAGPRWGPGSAWASSARRQVRPQWP